MNLHVTSSTFTTRSGLKPVPNEPSNLNLKPAKKKGVILLPTELTPLPQPEVLKTRTQLLQEITTHPDGVRINQTTFIDPNYLEKQYLRVFKAYLDRAEKDPSRQEEFIQKGIDYVKKRDEKLAKQLLEDTKFVEKRRESLESDKAKETKGVSVKDQIAMREEKLEEEKIPELEPPKLDLKKFKKVELLLQARALNIPRRSKMTKEELIKAIEDVSN